ncbi:queuosine-tRNA galactosyltransferase-like isoform X2 [Dysidea avara]|uniref:queuosine-tRNA galactosyltransferase-like isoform X2 n=1 Tax=Dysidea avara TaxID=196820 RepID=UPI00331AD16C
MPLMDDVSTQSSSHPTVSVVMTVRNGEQWLDESLSSLLNQTYTGHMELSVYNDGSTDKTVEILKVWSFRLEERHISVVLNGHNNDSPKGVGHGRNEAILQSRGRYLCFLDADDIMAPERIELQLKMAETHPNTLTGSCFERLPADSTPRYTAWCCGLSQQQLYTQAYTAFGPSIIQPTWFCERAVFDKAGPFSIAGKGTPEDLLFFYHHLELGGKLLKVDRPLLVYRYHNDCESFNVNRWTIWDARVKAIVNHVISKWEQFTIWNAGKEGRRLYRSLCHSDQQKVVAFCDVDVKKIHKGFYIYEESEGLTGGGFEENLASLNLVEGRDYYLFS